MFHSWWYMIPLACFCIVDTCTNGRYQATYPYSTLPGYKAGHVYKWNSYELRVKHCLASGPSTHFVWKVRRSTDGNNANRSCNTSMSQLTCTGICVQEPHQHTDISLSFHVVELWYLREPVCCCKWKCAQLLHRGNHIGEKKEIKWEGCMIYHWSKFNAH